MTIPDLAGAWVVFAGDTSSDAAQNQAYARLFVYHCVAGLPYGPGPRGVAAWVEAQAAPVVERDLAAVIAARVLAYGRAQDARRAG